MKMISSYILQKKIHETRNLIVYRGYKQNESPSFIIKVLKTQYLTPSQLARFKQEYKLVKNLNVDGVIKTYDLVEQNNNYAIIEEDFDGVSIKDMLKTRNFDIQSFLLIALKISETLGLLHKNNLIHRDIKPDNILFNTKEGTVKITDFGFPAIVTHANDELYNPDVIRRTLSYMSPEQTGRMNRSVDYRTDLYSLGIAFYEMLTGEVPFKSKDPMELIHSHIARQPSPPSALDPSIPPVLSAIILKLLSKTPEERYQNGLGLMADIDECLNQLTAKGKIDEFPLGTRDISIKLSIPQTIVGRETELNILMMSFERASRGAAEMTLVLGHPGIGKSALVSEIQKPIVSKKGYFIFGKYDQFRKDVPYSSIIQAFQGLIRQILAESEKRINVWKDKLLTALGTNGKVMTDVIPELGLIIGKQQNVPILAPEESRNRFDLVFKNFVNVFTTEDHPLAIFLDDLQWADMASLKLIRTIMIGHESKYLLIIGAYRDTEVSQGHPLSLTLDEIRKSIENINSITLGPLDATSINLIIMNVLICNAEKSMSLAELIHKKTAGNPFFVIQFLKNLYDKGIIELDPQSGWDWNINMIEQMEVTDNVVEFLAGKISNLPKNTRDILKICACVGNRFDLESLSVVSEKSIDETLADLTSAIREDMITLYGDMYKFHHDRIQEAAYSLIPDDEKAEMHYKIGNNVLKKTDLKDLNEKIFYIVDQLNRGRKQITGHKERINLVNLNLTAAAKAKNSTAFTAAAEYFETGKSLLSPEEWALLPDKLFVLSLEHAESTYLSGNIEKASGLCDRLFEIARNNLDRGSIYVLRARILKHQAKNNETVNEVRKALQLFNIALAEDHQEIDRKIGEGHGKMQGHLLKVPIEELVNLPEMKDENKAMAMELLFQVIPPAIHTYPPLSILVELMMFDLALSHGTTAVSCKNFMDCGIIQGSILGDYAAGYKLGEAAFALINKFKADSLKSSVYFVFGAFVSHWRVHYQQSLEYLAMSRQVGMETGDVEHVAYTYASMGETLLYAGKNLEECEREAEKAIVFLQKSQSITQLMLAKVTHHIIQQLQTFPRKNKEIDYEKNDDDFFESIKKTDNVSCLHSYGLGKILVTYLLGNMDAAEKWNSFTESFFHSGEGLFKLPDQFLIQSLILTKKWGRVTGDEQNKIMETLVKNLEKLKLWSDNCPSNFSHKYYLLSAEMAVIRGEPLETITDLYKKAIDSIGKDDFIHLRALANELQGNFWLEKAHETLGKAFIQEAHSLYKQWGATAKVKDLEEKHPDLIPDSLRKTGANSTTDIDASSGTKESQALDLMTVIRASRSLSSEIDLERLLATIMKLSIENAGAQHGYLILENEDNKKLYIEAVGKTDEAVEVLKSIPVEGNDSLSVSIVNYVKKTGENIVLNDAMGDERFINDPYIIAGHPKSILCAPLRHTGTMAGIIYLENNLTTYAFTPERLELLQLLSAQAAISIENSRLIAHRENGAKLQTEMQIAADIQSTLIPDNPIIDGFEITAYIKPANDIGGDYYDVINCGSNDWVVIGDVSGHGVPAGLVMMMVQSSIQTMVRKYPDLRPSELLSIVNETIKYNVKKMKDQKYMTITAFSFRKDGSAVYSGLHQDLLVYRASSSNVDVLSTGGLWLSPWDLKRENIDSDLYMKRGDTLLLYTDGLTEAIDAGNAMFSDNKLVGIFKKYGNLKTDEIRDKILEALQGYTLNDDVTVVLLKKI